MVLARNSNLKIIKKGKKFIIITFIYDDYMYLSVKDVFKSDFELVVQSSAIIGAGVHHLQRRPTIVRQKTRQKKNKYSTGKENKLYDTRVIIINENLYLVGKRLYYWKIK